METIDQSSGRTKARRAATAKRGRWALESNADTVVEDVPTESAVVRRAATNGRLRVYRRELGLFGLQSRSSHRERNPLVPLARSQSCPGGGASLHCWSGPGRVGRPDPAVDGWNGPRRVPAICWRTLSTYRGPIRKKDPGLVPSQPSTDGSNRATPPDSTHQFRLGPPLADGRDVTGRRIDQHERTATDPTARQ
ncbi:hypothetical protein CYV19_17540 [Natronobacterium gregoryi SP2]|nr:hypothetical protein CYV19_17540 [Natronobacterium gregoryi SP2]